MASVGKLAKLSYRVSGLQMRLRERLFRDTNSRRSPSRGCFPLLLFLYVALVLPFFAGDLWSSVENGDWPRATWVSIKIGLYFYTLSFCPIILRLSSCLLRWWGTDSLNAMKTTWLLLKRNTIASERLSGNISMYGAVTLFSVVVAVLLALFAFEYREVFQAFFLFLFCCWMTVLLWSLHPPGIILLAASNEETCSVLRGLRRCAGPLRVVSLLDPELDVRVEYRGLKEVRMDDYFRTADVPIDLWIEAAVRAGEQALVRGEERDYLPLVETAQKGDWETFIAHAEKVFGPQKAKAISDSPREHRCGSESWEAVVDEVCSIARMIVLDTRFDSAPTAYEAHRLFELDMIHKTAFLIADDIEGESFVHSQIMRQVLEDRQTRMEDETLPDVPPLCFLTYGQLAVALGGMRILWKSHPTPSHPMKEIVEEVLDDYATLSALPAQS